MLRDRYRVIVQSEWKGEACDALIALHARRSAGSIAAWRGERPQGGLAVVLTGTDLYRDLPGSLEAARSLELADRIVVLQEHALRQLKAPWRRKAQVIFQSAPVIETAAKPRGTLRCVAVGHLRGEKSPQTIWDAVRRLPPDLPVQIRHIGAALDEALGRQARECERLDRRYRYAGALSHRSARAAIRNAHLLLHPSLMEGGANVIVEAVMAGTAVLGSKMSGNIGMLGADYPGYFGVGDAAGLARLLEKAATQPAFLRSLEAACRRRRKLFRPEAEQRAVNRLAAELVKRSR
jgi:putative glycosyltransferase (TIGR04348 family)